LKRNSVARRERDKSKKTVEATQETPSQFQTEDEGM